MALPALGQTLSVARALATARLLRPARPDRLARAGLALLRWGPTPAAGALANALRYPDAVGLVDDRGPLTFDQLHLRSNALAHALSDRGVVEGDGIGLLARNHRHFVEVTLAASKLGANVLFLNTSFSGPQVAQVLERERPRALVFDAEFDDLVRPAFEAAPETVRIVGWWEQGPPEDGTEIVDDLILAGDVADLVPPGEPGKVVILTSGTTGPPKGANRSAPSSLVPVMALLERVPLHGRETTLIAAPLFHAWGAAHLQIGVGMSSTLVLQGRFDPEATLAAIDRHRPSTLAVVPVMLQRILDLPAEVRDRYDTSSLRVVIASGSALAADLARRFMDAYGEVLYNLYGSTEIAWATIATPEDLRAAPGTVGRAPLGTRLEVLGEDDRPLPTGQTGRIFVGHQMLFEGYTSGEREETVEGMMSAGDLGHLDAEGRLFVDARADDMIVSGGENVYPGEVEELLGAHERIVEAAVVGVDDEEFGQRLKAWVVARDRELTADEVRSHVKDNLARYKVPRDVEFIDELPRNAAGKVAKRELGSDEKADGG